MRRLVISGILMLMGGGVALAEPVDGTTARKMLFSPKGVDLRVIEDSGLSKAQVTILQALLKGMSANGLANYYGAVAVSPAFFDQMAKDPGQAALSGLLQVTERLHTPAAAATLAMTACQKARKRGDAACVLAGRIMPRKWTPQPVSLAVGATAAFRDYLKGKGPKAIAVSAGSGSYAIVKGEGASEKAMMTCNASAAKSGKPDCSVVIAD